MVRLIGRAGGGVCAADLRGAEVAAAGEAEGAGGGGGGLAGGEKRIGEKGLLRVWEEGDGRCEGEDGDR